MLILECPYCGVKAEETELAPGYEAHLKRFGPGSSDDDFEAYMFARKNPKGVHFERWRHAYGCGKWFLAARDTATLVRGEDHHGNFELLPRPSCDLDPVCIEAQKRASEISEQIREMAAQRHDEMVPGDGRIARV